MFWSAEEVGGRLCGVLFPGLRDAMAFGRIPGLHSKSALAIAIFVNISHNKYQYGPPLCVVVTSVARHTGGFSICCPIHSTGVQAVVQEYRLCGYNEDAARNEVH